MQPGNKNQQTALDKAAVRKSFDNAASRYDEAAVLQREVGMRLLERLDYMQITPRHIVDVGCGTGEFSRLLRWRYGKALVVGLDISWSMVTLARKRRGLFTRYPLLCADAESPPLADNSVDLIFSNLSLQWVNDLPQCFAEFQRILRPGGVLLFSSFGPDTLRELRASWAQVDDYPHVHHFVDLHLVGDALLQAGFKDPVTDVELLTMTYSHVRKLMQDLKAIGAHNASHGRRRGMLSRGQWRRFVQAYESFRRDGVLPASYEVVYGHAWGTAQACPGVCTVSIDSLRRR